MNEAHPSDAADPDLGPDATDALIAAGVTLLRDVAAQPAPLDEPHDHHFDPRCPVCVTLAAIHRAFREDSDD